MGFSTRECAWRSINVTILGKRLTGLKAFEVGKEIEKEYLYASGDEPIDIQSGNKSYPGSLTVLKHEFDQMNEAAQLAGYLDITEIPHDQILINVEFKKRAQDPIRFITVPGLEFNSLKFANNQNDKFMDVPLPFMGMRLILGAIGI